MPSVNKVILLGNLCKDPETRYLPNGDAVTNATLAAAKKQIYNDRKNNGNLHS